jgi:FkbM family methyltransferase
MNQQMRFVNPYDVLSSFSMFLVLSLLSSKTTTTMANSFRGIHDPKTILEKRNVDCTLDGSVSFRSQYMEDQIIYEKFYSSPSSSSSKCNDGVVLEIGGLDGNFASNSWFFQYALHWTAILVEANPTMYQKMTENRPDAINVWNAICRGETAKFQLTNMEATDGLVDEMTEANRIAVGNVDVIDVPCSTLSDLLVRYDIRHVDVFFLDVEGAELIVLETIDWTKVTIDILVVEMSYADLTKNDKIRKFLSNLGYKTPFSMHEICQERKKQLGKEDQGCMPSDVFVRESVWTSLQ